MIRVEKAKPHARGIDTVVPLTSSHCRMLVRSGIDYVVRYLHGRYAITPDERDRILCSGLALMLVTPSRAPGWITSPGLGAEDGQLALDALADLKIPVDDTVWLDYEGCTDTLASQSEWINEWSYMVRNNGYEAGIYVGMNPNSLDSAGLWKLPYVTRYWRSGSRVPEPATRGWCMQQLRPLDVSMDGLRVDHNVIETDYLGNLPTWLVA